MDAKENKLFVEYNNLFDEISETLKGYDFCQFDKTGLCKVHREEKLKTGENLSKFDPCCCCGGNRANGKNHCDHYIVGKGCNTKAISCKLWFCYDLEVPKELQHKLNKLEDKARKKGFYIVRGDFQDCLKRMKLTKNLRSDILN
jgi:hypothetical protein